MADYIPAADAAFNAWQHQFLVQYGVYGSTLGADPPDPTAAGVLQTAWENAYPDCIAAQNYAHGKRQAKDDTRGDFEAALRALVRQIQAHPLTTDEFRANLGITGPAGESGASHSAASGDLAPTVVVNSSQRLRHEIQFFDSSSATRRGKPAGVMGAEIWVKVGGEPPIDGSQCQMLGLDTASPYLAVYDGADGNKTAHYMLRWVTTQGYKGPWGETVSATIGA